MTNQTPKPQKKASGCFAWLLIIVVAGFAVYYGGLGLYRLLALIAGTIQQMEPIDRLCLCIIAASAMHATWMRHKKKG